MKRTVIVGFFILLSSLTVWDATAWGAEHLKVPRLKSVGAGYGHLVLAQTTPEFVEKRAGIVILRRYYIASWGPQRFEYGMAQYQCRNRGCELLGEVVALKFFEECSGFKKSNQPNCKNLESARVDVSDPQENNERDESSPRSRVEESELPMNN
jgi:hypothetical protein